MEHKQVDIELSINADTLNPHLTRDYILSELKRVRDQGVASGYTLTDEALNEIADRIAVNPSAPDVTQRLTQMIRERAQPIDRQAGRMLTSSYPGQNRKQRRAAQAAARRSK
jgi:hypothetical protein